jgi:ribosomal protein L12E/L44/L45/RPP1/RPP2
MKKGGGASQETAEKIAQGAGVDLTEVWMASLIQKEQNPRFKSILENISKRAGIAAGVLLAVMMGNGLP